MAAETREKKAAFRSLAVTIAIAFIGLSMVILAFVTISEVYFNSLNQNQMIASQQQLIAKNAANTVKSFVQEKFSIMDSTASIGSMAADNPEQQKNTLDKLLGRELSFRQLVLLDAQDRKLAEISRLSQSASTIDRWLDSDMLAQVREGKRYAGPVYIDQVTSEPMMIMAVPVKDVFGDFKGTFAAEVNLKFMWDLVESIKIGNSGTAYVVDRNGKLIAFSDISRVLKGENMMGLEQVADFAATARQATESEMKVSKGIGGSDVVANFVSLGTPDWAVVVEMPVQEAYSTITQQLAIAAWIAFLSLLLAVAMGIYLSRRITKPIIGLRDAAIKIGEGKLDTKIEIKSKSEIGELVSAFNQMASDLKNSHEQIKKHSEELEQNVQERTAELDSKLKELETSRVAILNMMEDVDSSNKDLLEAQGKLKRSFSELKKLDQDKDTFISIAAHELKTPMTAIHGFAQLLENEKVVKDAEARNKYLKIIEHEVDRLAKLVTEVLDLSRIDLGTIKFTIESVDVAKMAEEVETELAEKAKSKKLFLKFRKEKGLPIVQTDKERLRQVLINIVDNSIKYSAKGGTTVDISKEGGFVRFTVADTGIGIPKENQAKMFTRFYQVENPLTRKVGGTGLGLSICKEFVDALGGKIWFESHAGRGTKFFFTIPIKSRVAETNKYQRKNSVKKGVHG